MITSRFFQKRAEVGGREGFEMNARRDASARYRLFETGKSVRNHEMWLNQFRKSSHTPRQHS